MSKPNGKDDRIRIILNAVLGNGFIQGQTYNIISTGILDSAEREVRRELKQALQKQREQLKEKIENKDLPKGGVYTPQYMKDYAEGYNACLQEVLQILNR